MFYQVAHCEFFLRIMKASPGCYVSMQAKALMFSFQPLNHGTQLPRSFSLFDLFMHPMSRTPYKHCHK